MLENLHYGPFFEEVSSLINNPPRYLNEKVFSSIAVLLMLVLVCHALFFSNNNQAGKKLNNVLFLSISILTLFIYRGLSFYSDLYNPDESHILTAALNLLPDVRLWVDADSTTLGPVNSLLVVLVVSILRFVGIDCDITYFLLRCIMTLLIIGTFVFLHKICLKNLSLKLSRVVLLFYVFFFSFCYHYDLQSYNTEYPFCFFFSLCIYLLYRIKKSANYLPILLAGFFCGLLPYTKLQAAPMMVAYILWALYVIWNVSKITNKERTVVTIRKIIVFFAAVLIPTVSIVIYCSTYENGLSNAYLYYVKNAMAHVNIPLFSKSFFLMTCHVLRFFFFQNWYASLFILILFSAFLLITIRPRLSVDWKFSCLVLLSSFFAIIRPGVYFTHYALFMLVPALVFFILTLHLVSSGKSSPLNKENVLPAFLIILWLFFFNGFAQNVKENTILTHKGLLVGSENDFSAISQIILQQTNPEDYIVVWGWEARIYVYTNRRSATAQSDIERLWVTGKKEYPHENVTNYINDIKTNRPKLIVDVVAPKSFRFNDEKFSIENHEEIWSAIKDDYILTGVYPVEGGSFKIYTRKNE
jgi:hypothetical protein